MANNGIGTKTLAESYNKLIHTGSDDGITADLSQLCVSAGGDVYPSALWLGSNGASQTAIIKAHSDTQRFFSLESHGTANLETSIIIEGISQSGVARGLLRLKQILEVKEGTAGLSKEGTAYDGGMIVFGGLGASARHAIYTQNSKTVFDDGRDTYGNNVGNFKFNGLLEVGDIQINPAVPSISNSDFNGGNLDISQSYELSAAIGNQAEITAVDSLHISAANNSSGDGVFIGQAPGVFSPLVQVKTMDDTEALILIDAKSTPGSTANASISLGTQVFTTGEPSEGTQLITIGANDGTSAAASSPNFCANTNVQETRLKSPKTYFETGHFYMKIKDASHSHQVFPTFYGANVDSGEAVISTQTSGSGTPTSPSKLFNDDRNLLLFSENGANYEIPKYDISKGRVDFYKGQAASPSNVVDDGDAKIYARDSKFVINTQTASNPAWYYLDMVEANTTIQEAQPAAMTSSNAAGSPTQGEYDALRADVVALRSTVEDLMTELKTFRLWKEAGGDI